MFSICHVPNYRELGRPSDDFEGHVGSPDHVMGRIWRLGDRLSTALISMHFGGTVDTAKLTSSWTFADKN